MTDKNIFILNCGSSSLKFSVINALSGTVLMQGDAQQLGGDKAFLRCTYNGEKSQAALDGNHSHEAALHYLVGWMQAHTVIQASMIGVGHRVVHGGDVFTQATILDANKLALLRGLVHLAPLHNPSNILGIEAAMAAFPHLPQVAVFDTSFHRTLPEQAYLYALPYSVYEQFKVRRYGFHGSSYAYVCQRAAQLAGLDLNGSKIIIAHLGNGASVCALKNGESVDTSMGFTPLEGLVMGTRCGDLDATVPNYLCHQMNIDSEQMEALLNKKSGLLGLSEMTNDFRELEQGYSKGDVNCIRAIDVFVYRLAKYIASYTVPLSGLDLLVFTGGIGENSALARRLTLEKLQHLGLQLNVDLNQKAIAGAEGMISTQGSIPVMVVPTNEEWMIAQHVAEVIKVPQ